MTLFKLPQGRSLRLLRATPFLYMLILCNPALSEDLRSDFLFDIDIEVAEPNIVGNTRNGDRAIYQVTGGRFDGPELKGRVVNGADWALKRTDGNFDLDVRLTLETDQGAILYMFYTGILTALPDVFANLEQGGTVTDDQYYMRTTPRFEASDERLSWLNTTVFVGVGRITEMGVNYKVYATRAV